ncbi:hypothetical protein L1987_24116 [Smallanthus sonchifolius]|uniref:Uncharacterized protein n=1 Tax=Smallanthus sonchifolius TaxID=185202 RepID=A0ACB9IJK5_9ASTR|nr:hypothetical protein L1987_24116 [Smallanthus sonchifolius]
METAEELKALSPHQYTARIELSTPSPQQTPSPMKDHPTPSPQRTITTRSSSRKKRIAIKKRKASITSWNHVGRRYVIKRDDNTREMFKCISDVMELSNSDLEKIVSLGIDRFNDSESARLLIRVLKEREYLSVDRIITLVPDDLRALLKIPLNNDSNDQMGEYVKDAMHKQLDSLSSSESSQEEEDEGKKEKFFGDEDHPNSSENDEVGVDTKVPLAESQVPISEWYYDLELKKFVIKRLDFTYSVFSNLVDLSLLSPTELKLLRLMPLSTTTEEGTKLQERIRQSVWTIRGQEDAVPVSVYVPITSWEWWISTTLGKYCVWMYIPC